jgi:hypothetical protein
MKTGSTSSVGGFARALSAALLVVVPSLRADVIVVDPQGGSGVGLLTQALANAHDGDILILKAGNYAKLPGELYFLDAHKALTLLADPDAGTVVLPGLLSGNEEPQAMVVVRGLTIAPVLNDVPWWKPNASVLANGSLWLEDCTIRGADDWLKPSYGVVGGWAAVEGGNRTVITHCTLVGGKGLLGAPSFSEKSGHDGLRVPPGASVILADSDVRGGAASGSDSHPSAGDGVYDYGDSVSYVWITGSHVQGGETPVDADPLCKPGHGLGSMKVDWHPIVLLRDSEILAGPVLGAGLPVSDIDAPTANLLWMPAAARSCQLPAPALSGSEVPLTLNGQPGDLVLLIVSPQGNAWPKLQLQGLFAVAPQLAFIAPPVLITSPSGVEVVNFRLPDVPLEFGGGITLFIQGAFLGSDGATLGAPTTLVWLDAGF